MYRKQAKHKERCCPRGEMEMKAKERLGALFIGLIMLLSVAGFALSNPVDLTGNQEESKIDLIIKGEMSPADVVYILRNGKTILRYYYAADEKSIDDKIKLEVFANKIKNYVVLNEIEANETSLEIIGAVAGEGRIVNYEGVINETGLFSKFCEIAVVKPKECFLNEI